MEKIFFLVEKFSDCAYYKKIINNYKNTKLKKSNSINKNYCPFVKYNNKLNKYIKYEHFYRQFKSHSVDTNSICNNYTNTFNINTQDIKKVNNNENMETNNINIINKNIENKNDVNNNNDNNNEIKSKESLIFIINNDFKSNTIKNIKDYKNEIIQKSENDGHSKANFLKMILYEEYILIEEKDEIKFIESFLVKLNYYEDKDKDTIFHDSFTFKINENISVEIYNYFINGKDKLILYDRSSKYSKEILTIQGYSFTFEINGFDIMHNKILLCPCKKYVEGQKNGIFLIDFQSKEFQFYFEDTKNFQVNSICSLYDKYNKQNDFFLVAGINNGVIIKLYKLICDDYKYKSITIKYIDDFIVRKYEYSIDYKSPIKSIKQPKKTIMCLNKKIYKFAPPNLDKYLLFEENEKYKDLYDIESSEEPNLYDKDISGEPTHYDKST